MKPIIQRIINKVRNALYSIKGFLKNPHISIPYKRVLFSAIVIGQVSYYAPLLGSNKDRMRRTQTDTVITDMNNIELNSDSDSSNEVYNINNINNRNNIVNNSRNSDCENRINK